MRQRLLARTERAVTLMELVVAAVILTVVVVGVIASIGNATVRAERLLQHGVAARIAQGQLAVALEVPIDQLQPGTSHSSTIDVVFTEGDRSWTTTYGIERTTAVDAVDAGAADPHPYRRVYVRVFWPADAAEPVGEVTKTTLRGGQEVGP